MLHLLLQWRPGLPQGFHAALQGLGGSAYERKKQEAADAIIARLEVFFPGITQAIVFRCGCPGCGPCPRNSSPTQASNSISAALFVLGIPPCLLAQREYTVLREVGLWSVIFER